jgi:hypothetical protein
MRLLSKQDPTFGGPAGSDFKPINGDDVTRQGAVGNTPKARADLAERGLL